jgi:hypothetical protein
MVPVKTSSAVEGEDASHSQNGDLRARQAEIQALVIQSHIPGTEVAMELRL